MATKNVTVATIKEMKQKGEPIVMITAYDVAMARNEIGRASCRERV